MQKHILLISILLILSNCAPMQEQPACQPNFQGGGMSIHMSSLHDNSDGTRAYLIKLCGDAKPNPIVFSVYGGAVTDSSIESPSQNVRRQQIIEASYSGAQFEVSFKSYDSWFVIYQDNRTSTGYALDTTNELVRGNLSQAEYAEGIVAQ